MGNSISSRKRHEDLVTATHQCWTLIHEKDFLGSGEYITTEFVGEGCRAFAPPSNFDSFEWDQEKKRSHIVLQSAESGSPAVTSGSFRRWVCMLSKNDAALVSLFSHYFPQRSVGLALSFYRSLVIVQQAGTYPLLPGYEQLYAAAPTMKFEPHPNESWNLSYADLDSFDSCKSFKTMAPKKEHYAKDRHLGDFDKVFYLRLVAERRLPLIEDCVPNYRVEGWIHSFESMFRTGSFLVSEDDDLFYFALMVLDGGDIMDLMKHFSTPMWKDGRMQGMVNGSYWDFQNRFFDNATSLAFNPPGLKIAGPSLMKFFLNCHTSKAGEEDTKLFYTTSIPNHEIFNKVHLAVAEKVVMNPHGTEDASLEAFEKVLRLSRNEDADGFQKQVQGNPPEDPTSLLFDLFQLMTLSGVCGYGLLFRLQKLLEIAGHHHQACLNLLSGNSLPFHLSATLIAQQPKVESADIFESPDSLKSAIHFGTLKALIQHGMDNLDHPEEDLLQILLQTRNKEGSTFRSNLGHNESVVVEWLRRKGINLD